MKVLVLLVTLFVFTNAAKKIEKIEKGEKVEKTEKIEKFEKGGKVKEIEEIKEVDIVESGEDGDTLLSLSIDECEKKYPMNYEEAFGEAFDPLLSETENVINIYSGSRPLKCYLRCLGIGMGIMKEDNSDFNYSLFQEMFQISTTKANNIKTLVDNCNKKIKESDDCDRYHALCKCAFLQSKMGIFEEKCDKEDFVEIEKLVEIEEEE